MRLLVIAASPGFPARPPKNIDEAFETMPATADDSLQVKGEATTGLVQAMRRETMGPEVKLMKKDIFDVNDRATELLGAFQVMEKWTKGAPLSEAEKAAIRADPARREVLAKQLGDEAIAAIKTMTHATPMARRRRALTASR